METRQQYKTKAGNINVENRGMSSETYRKFYPGWLYILIGAMLALQVVQFVLIAVLYLYIHSIEGRLETDIREGNKEVIQFMERR